jgi:hypothetical protein
MSDNLQIVDLSLEAIQPILNDNLKSLLQNSHSPQASAWGDSKDPILRNRFNGFRVLNQAS